MKQTHTLSYLRNALSFPCLTRESTPHSPVQIVGSSTTMTQHILNKTLFILLFSIIFISCSKKTIAESSGSTPATAAQSPSVQVQKAEQPASSTTNATSSSKPDFDLTKMSATMIYSTIFDMLIMPEEYVEKVIKVKGWFETYTNPESGELFYAVVVPDATACCQQGLEFIWPGDHHYPADFPDPGQDVTVTGRYKLVDKDGFAYNYLEATEVEF